MPKNVIIWQSVTHFLFRKTILNTKHAIAKIIPRLARQSNIATSHSLNVRIIFIGVPSNGRPPEKPQNA